MSGSMSRVNESFAKRFEPDGDGYLFRKTLRAEGVRVTVAERDRFVADFRRWTRISTWGVVALMILLMVGGVFALDSSGATFAHSTDRGRSFHAMVGADTTRRWAV